VWRALAVVALFTAAQPAVSFIVLNLPGVASDSARFAIAVPAALGLSHLLGWLGAWWVVRGRQHRPFAASLGLGPFRASAGQIIRWLMLGMVMQVLARLVVLAAPPPPDLDFPLLDYLETGGEAVAFLVFAVVIMAPLLEEVLFRGLLLQALRRRMPFWPAALVVTALFSALHALQFQDYLPALAGIAALGLLLAWLRERSGSLWPPILVHAGFNLLGLLPLLVYLKTGPG